MTELEPTASAARGISPQTILFEVARVCNGCPSPRSLLDPRDHCEEVEGARAIAMYLLHHPDVRDWTPAMIAIFFTYERGEVERYCELVEEAISDNARVSAFLDGMIRRLRDQAGLNASVSRNIPAALPTQGDMSERVREILAQRSPRVIAPNAFAYVRGVTDDESATEASGVPPDAIVADLFRSPDDWQERPWANPYEQEKKNRSKVRGRKARIVAAFKRAKAATRGASGNGRAVVPSKVSVGRGGMLSFRVADPQITRYKDGTMSFLIKNH